MKNTTRLAPLALVLCCASSAFGHGFTLRIQGNNFVLDTQGSSRPLRVGYVPPPPPENENSGDPLTFAHALNDVGAPPNDMSHGSVGLVNDPADALDLGDSYQIEFRGPIWFSDGGLAVPSSYSLSASSRNSVALEIDTHVLTGTSPPDTMMISGHSSHSVIWTLDDAAADGVYAWTYRVLWDDAGGSVEYRKTNWVTLLGFTSGFASDPDLLDAELAAVAASVPEPSSLALACCAAAVCGGAIVRRRRAAGKRRSTLNY
jgi:hypothetical protein